ncbi:PREDICTED: protein-lysine N-methyltransferase Mettl10-like [Amphimedon queenslandica]|uniref:Protein-lysine N-methyltransferase 100633496 n=1 Tax=Amphimedon queenslandica TaxID=400682 RepID=A0A1X7VRG6_AMPQE|nr:PREDICTED: protein-lysine N-methyltransferase Mettl10-like [Amphimedon queenslandica]|eukprot:XP_003383000.1 PREDICTED: protein-lysine N-methyltransferase Mettl10-like [Amphimedon queenslandica]
MSDPEEGNEGNGELPASSLGTKEHWDNEYARELEVFKEFGDIGEVWFGYDCQTRVVNWIKESSCISLESNIIDLGCGNGSLLIELACSGYTQLTGIDYSAAAVELAKQIALKEKAKVKFLCGDILTDDTIEDMIGQIDLVLDKGTYDAISLSPNEAKTKRKAYNESVLSLLKKDGLFIIVSCNWTQDELKDQFSSGYVVLDTIPSPSFWFGGNVGQTTSTVVFKKT